MPEAQPFKVELRSGGGGCEIWLSPAGSYTAPPMTVYCIGALRMPGGLGIERLANSIQARHRDRPADVLLWHVGADTAMGGLLGDTVAAPDGAQRVAAFLGSAGDFGLWWPETWRNVSRHLRARPALAGLAVVLLQDKVDRAPHYWKGAKDDFGFTIDQELARRRRLKHDATLIVVGEGDRCFTDDPGLRCITVTWLLQELERAPEQPSCMVETCFGVDIFGLGDSSREVHADWQLRKLNEHHLLYPRRSITLAEACLLVSMPGVNTARIKAEVHKN